MTAKGKERLKEGGMEGAYLGPDGAVHIPGKKVTLYSEESPTYEEMKQVCKHILLNHLFEYIAIQISREKAILQKLKYNSV